MRVSALPVTAHVTIVLVVKLFPLKSVGVAQADAKLQETARSAVVLFAKSDGDRPKITARRKKSSPDYAGPRCQTLAAARNHPHDCQKCQE
jgi:hypothetical protein